MNTRSSLEVLHGIPESMRETAARLYQDAFGPKFSVAIKSERQLNLLLRDSIDLRYVFGAVADGTLVGLAGYKTDAGSFTDGMTYQKLLQYAGIVRGNWAALIFSLYERSMVSGEFLMDGIVVDSNRRGEGIGTLLLDELTSYAAQSGFKSVRLDVIDTNPAAKRMYERNGFVVTRSERFPYLRWLLGFGGADTMHRILSEH